jgi:predicted RNA binding protein YcfA (HicA-like mRNA interferase family)
MTAREVVAALKADGWLLVRTKGSHAQYVIRRNRVW